jgi:hypothetical protein
LRIDLEQASPASKICRASELPLDFPGSPGRLPPAALPIAREPPYLIQDFGSLPSPALPDPYPNQEPKQNEKYASMRFESKKDFQADTGQDEDCEESKSKLGCRTHAQPCSRVIHGVSSAIDCRSIPALRLRASHLRLTGRSRPLRQTRPPGRSRPFGRFPNSSLTPIHFPSACDGAKVWPPDGSVPHQFPVPAVGGIGFQVACDRKWIGGSPAVPLLAKCWPWIGKSSPLVPRWFPDFGEPGDGIRRR